MGKWWKTDPFAGGKYPVEHIVEWITGDCININVNTTVGQELQTPRAPSLSMFSFRAAKLGYSCAQQAMTLAAEARGGVSASENHVFRSNSSKGVSSGAGLHQRGRGASEAAWTRDILKVETGAATMPLGASSSAEPRGQAEKNGEKRAKSS